MLVYWCLYFTSTSSVKLKSEACSSVYSYVSIVNNFKEKMLLPRCECMGALALKEGVTYDYD